MNKMIRGFQLRQRSRFMLSRRDLIVNGATVAATASIPITAQANVSILTAGAAVRAASSFFFQIVAGVTAASVYAHLKRGSAEAVEIEQVTDRMARKGGFTQHVETYISSDDDKRMSVMKNEDRGTTCCAVFANGKHVRNIDGPTISALDQLAEQSTRTRPFRKHGKNMISRIIYPTEHIMSPEGDAVSGYKQPDVFKSDLFTIRCEYNKNDEKSWLGLYKKYPDSELVFADYYPLIKP